MACLGNSLDISDREYLSQLFNTHIDPTTFKILVEDGELPKEDEQPVEDSSDTSDTSDTEESNDDAMPY